MPLDEDERRMRERGLISGARPSAAHDTSPDGATVLPLRGAVHDTSPDEAIVVPLRRAMHDTSPDGALVTPLRGAMHDTSPQASHSITKEDWREVVAKVRAPRVPTHLPRVNSTDGLTAAAYDVAPHTAPRSNAPARVIAQSIEIDRGPPTAPTTLRNDVAEGLPSRSRRKFFYVFCGALAFLLIASSLYAVVRIAVNPQPSALSVPTGEPQGRSPIAEPPASAIPAPPSESIPPIASVVPSGVTEPSAAIPSTASAVPRSSPSRAPSLPKPATHPATTAEAPTPEPLHDIMRNRNKR